VMATAPVGGPPFEEATKSRELAPRGPHRVSRDVTHPRANGLSLVSSFARLWDGRCDAVQHLGQAYISIENDNR